MNVQKRVSQGLKVLQYYTTRDWVFKNDNLQKLQQEMNSVDKEKFWLDGSKVDCNEYLLNYILGTRHFLLKEKPESIPKARAMLKRFDIVIMNLKCELMNFNFFRLYYLDKLASILFYALILYFFLSNFATIFNFFDYIFKGRLGFSPVN